MDTLHKHDYSIESAMCSLVPSSGPVLCRDEMEEWSASEANLFEEALDKYGKDFTDIRQDFVSTYRKRVVTIKHFQFLFSIMIIMHFSNTFHDKKKTKQTVSLTQTAAMENAKKHRRILLYVENNRPLRTTKTIESR